MQNDNKALELIKAEGYTANSRIDAIDVIRTIAIIMVVLNHVTARFFKVAPFDSFTWFTSVVYYCFHNGTSLFFMVTGMVFLKPGHSVPITGFLRSRFLRVLLPSIFWVIFFTFYRAWYLSDVSSAKEMLINALNGPVYYHLWYVYALIPLYLVLPIINKLMQYSNQEIIEYILLLWFIGFSIVPAFQSIIPSLELNWLITIFGNFLGFMVAGSYFYWFKSNFQRNKIFIVYSIMFFLVIGSLYLVRFVNGKPDAFFASRNSPFMVVMSLCIFLIATQINYAKVFEKFKWIQKLVHWVADSSFSIYILHVIIIELVPKYSELWLGYRIDGKLFGHPLIGIPLFTFFAVSVLTGFSQLFRKIPIIRNLLKVGGSS